ncbi:MAG: BPTI/Kunitz-type proteinase inhibitor domain-containing protein [Sulfurimonadaceae bacterium]
MMIRILLIAGLFILSGCSSMGLNRDSVAVVTKEYGQCIANTKAAPSFNKKKVTFRCEKDRVLLGGLYEKDGVEYIDSARLSKKDGKYVIKDRKSVQFVRGLHSVCQLKPMQGEGDKKIKRFYFDMKLKECRPFNWNGKGGFVPFKNVDECEQYCKYQYGG